MRKTSIIVPALLACLTGCTQEEAGGTPEILPHISPIVLGDMYPQGAEDPDLASNERTPYEFVLLLQATGDAPAEVSDACLVGPAADQFILEGPKPERIEPSTDGAIRLTYTRTDPSASIDDVAIVVQSDAENFPTLVVPVCARVVADGEERRGFDCTSPVTVADGARGDTLCD